MIGVVSRVIRAMHMDLVTMLRVIHTRITTGVTITAITGHAHPRERNSCTEQWLVRERHEAAWWMTGRTGVNAPGWI